MRELFRTFPLMCAVLLIPVLPFLAFGESMESWLRGVSEDPPAPLATAGLVVGLLATDIFLPIPSSVISTLSGWQLGWMRGTLATWAGMTIGAAVGFALAKRWGQPFARWFSSGEDLVRMHELSERYGPLILVLTRAVPVFAEASVLIAGIHQLSWQRFLPAVLLSNLGVAFAYSALGEYAQQNQWLPLALGVSIALPVLLALFAKRYLPEGGEQNSGEVTD
jgi:uncharacterized membrane protein YdjX (TVP38/TMEM64 family)